MGTMAPSLSETRSALPPQAQFDSAIEDFRSAAKHIFELMQRESELRQAIVLRKVDLDCIEAKYIAVGLIGKNEPERKANLALVLREDEEYRGVLIEQSTEEAELGRTQAQLELWRDARSIAKRRCEAWIAIHNAAGRE